MLLFSLCVIVNTGETSINYGYILKCLARAGVKSHWEGLEFIFICVLRFIVSLFMTQLSLILLHFPKIPCQFHCQVIMAIV